MVDIILWVCVYAAQKQTNLAVSVVKPPFPGESSSSGGQNSHGEDVLSLEVPSKQKCVHVCTYMHVYWEECAGMWVCRHHADILVPSL